MTSKLGMSQCFRATPPGGQSGLRGLGWSWHFPSSRSVRLWKSPSSWWSGQVLTAGLVKKNSVFPNSYSSLHLLRALSSDTHWENQGQLVEPPNEWVHTEPLAFCLWQSRFPALGWRPQRFRSWVPAPGSHDSLSTCLFPILEVAVCVTFSLLWWIWEKLLIFQFI